MDYLGTVLTEDGCVDRELNRRIGMAKTDFRGLNKVWRRANLGQQRKLMLYDALVLSRLLYGLAACCLTTAQQRRLNGFNAKCLRQVLGVAPAYESRISNAVVLRRAERGPASNLLLEQQLKQFGKALRAPEDSPLHTCAFVPGSPMPLVSHYIRRIGRPRREWVPSLLPVAEKMTAQSRYFGLYAAAKDTKAWNHLAQSLDYLSL